MFRCENALIDALSQLATSAKNSLGQTYIKYLEAPSINEIKEVQQLTDDPSWMDPYIKFLIEDIFLIIP